MLRRRSSARKRRARQPPHRRNETSVKDSVFLIVFVVIVTVAGVSYLYVRYPDVPPAENITVQATPEKIARGQYLSEHVTRCTGCHAIRDFTRYGAPIKAGTAGGGGERFGEVGSGFEVYSTNIPRKRLASGAMAS